MLAGGTWDTGVLKDEPGRLGVVIGVLARVTTVYNLKSYSRGGTHKIEVSNINIFMHYIQPSMHKTVRCKKKSITMSMCSPKFKLWITLGYLRWFCSRLLLPVDTYGGFIVG